MSKTQASAPRRMRRVTSSGKPCATSTFVAADALYEELLAQCEALMDARKGSKRADDLHRLAKIVEAYEEVRWPLTDKRGVDSPSDIKP